MDAPKCSICGRPAIVHLQQVVGGVEQKIELCEVCARNYGVLPNDESPFSVLKSISSALFSQLGSSIRGARCSQCGCTSESFRERGQLGCAQCYQDLEDKLLPLLGNAQKSLQHIGKFPKTFKKNEPKSSSLDDLSAKLKRAIDEERFEDAAKLRDQIRNFQENERG